jgi:hypothetical protein
MSKIINELKFQTQYYYKNVLGYLADLGSALIGRTRKQAAYIDGLVDSSLKAVARLSAENAELKRKLDRLESKPKALKKIAGETPSKKKAATKSPKKGQ